MWNDWEGLPQSVPRFVLSVPPRWFLASHEVACWLGAALANENRLDWTLGFGFPVPCRHGPPAPSMQLPPHRACALTRIHRALLQRHMARMRPGPDHRRSHRSGLAMETPRLLSYSSFKDRLSIDIRPVRPLGTEAPATDCHACRTFRSCRFSRLQRFPPHRPVWACCIPLPTMRFTWFRADRRLLPTTPPSSQV
jgi:hypothetical protein